MSEMQAKITIKDGMEGFTRNSNLLFIHSRIVSIFLSASCIEITTIHSLTDLSNGGVI